MRFTLLTASLQNRYVLLRHGETDANKQKIYMGGQDYGLNEIGLKHATQVELPFIPDVVFTSTLKRTKETAASVLAGSTSIKIQEDARLVEKSGGDIEGKTYDEIAKNYPDVWNIWDDKPIEYILKARFPNGESDAEVINRVEKFFVDMEQKYQNKNILIVTHSGVFQAIRYLIGKTKDEIYLTPVPSCLVEEIVIE